MRDTHDLGGLTWAKAERLFRAADAHKPEGQRFESWKPSQVAAHEQWDGLHPGKASTEPLRIQLLLFPTGEGKSKTSLAQIASRGHDEIYVVAPPKTHPAWQKDAAILGVHVELMSHKAFRERKNFSRKPFIIDEVHMLGARTGDGFKRLRRMVDKMPALILCSATPNYNKPERAYCLDVIGEKNPISSYERWMNTYCTTEPNRFAYYPTVTGFKEYDSAIDFLVARPWVAYVEDTATWTAAELKLPRPDLVNFEKLNFSKRHHRLMNSDMEKRHKRVDLQLIDDDGFIRSAVMVSIQNELDKYPERDKWLIFCMHKTVANALHRTLSAGDPLAWVLDGDTKTEDVDKIIHDFSAPGEAWLIGTTAMATGVDGIDKVCTSMLILDDIDGDHAKRRQLIGRILPRGTADKRERLVITASVE
ncbi:DNA helicase [Microbacterium phage PineapplePluto]|nr:DNA helicase [Microbacterium phage PineapplePluto]